MQRKERRKRMKSSFFNYCICNDIKVLIFLYGKGRDADIQTGRIISYDEAGVGIRTMKNEDCYYPFARIIKIELGGVMSLKEKRDIARAYPRFKEQVKDEED